MPDQTTHPSPDELSAFNLGQLPPETAAAVEDHISECEACCETLLGLASHDTFIGLLKQAKQADDDESVNPTFVTGVRRQANRVTIPEALTEHTRYEVVRLIGKGGMGDVFEARHRMMDRTVALKVINHEFIRKPQAVDRFHREVKAAARLVHPNIVTAYDAEQAGDLHFLVMEYVDGVDLANLVKDRGLLSVDDACAFARQAAIGLQHAYEQGMVHRDIKPHNLMVTGDGTVKILDFGLASLAPEALPEEESGELRGELTAAGAIIGTPDFISPEQARDAHQADIRSDIYSLGATLYYLLCGRAPFADASVIEKLKSHAEQEPVPLENLQVEIPEELADVIRKMMAKDPEQRYQTPQAVADALAPFVDRFRSTEERLHEESDAEATRYNRFKAPLWPLYLTMILNLTAYTLLFRSFGEFLSNSLSISVVKQLLLGCVASSVNAAIACPLMEIGLSRRSFRTVVAAAILCVLPFNPLAILMLPLNLWALSVLLRTETRRAIRNGTLDELETKARADRRSKILAWIGAVAVGVVLARGITIVTDRGTLEIESVDDSVSVEIWQVKEETRQPNLKMKVLLIDEVTGSKVVRLPSGTYKVSLADENSTFQLNQDGFTLNRGGKIVLKVTERKTIPEPKSTSDVATAETRRLFEQLIAAVNSANKTEDWQQIIDQRAPLTAALPLQAARDLILLLTELPSDSRKSLLQDGYLKWQFSSLDQDRQSALVQMLATASMPKNLKSLNMTEKDFHNAMRQTLEASDVGFAVIRLPETQDQSIVWYSLSPASTAPTFFPITGLENDDQKLLTRKEVIQQLWEMDEKPYSARPARRIPKPDVATQETRRQFEEMIAAAGYAESDEDWKLVLAEHTPVLFLLSQQELFSPDTGRDLVRLLADLPDEMHAQLLQGGYLKWRATDLDEPAKQVVKAVLRALGNKNAQADEKGLQALFEVSDTGFVVLDLPQSETQVVAWYARHDNFPIPSIMLLSGGTASAIQESLQPEVRQSVEDLKNRPYSDLPPAPAATPEIRAALTVLRENFPAGDVSDEQWNDFVAEHSPFLAATKAPGKTGRNLVTLLHDLPQDSVDMLLQQGYVKWKFTRLGQAYQEQIRSMMQDFFSSVPDPVRDEKIIEVMMTSLISADVGFVVLNRSDLEDQFLAYFLQMPLSTQPTIFPVLGDTRGDFRELNSPEIQQQIKDILKQPDSAIPQSRLAEPAADAVNAQTRQQIEQLVSAVADAKTEADWKKLLAEHTPVLADFPEQTARTLLEVLGGFPETTRRELIKSGYLKWRFKDLDSARQQTFKTIFGDVLAMNDHPDLDREAVKQLASVMDVSDTGFAVLESPETESDVLVWFAVRPDAPVPNLIPILGVDAASGSKIFKQKVYRQFIELEDQPYSRLPPVADTLNHALQFNGDSTAVSLPIRYDGSHPITLECTVLLEDHGEVGRMLLSDTHDAGINLQISQTDQKLLFSPRSEQQAQPIAWSRDKFPFGKKVHVAGVYTGQEVRLYLNGILQETVQVPDDFRFEPSPMKLAVGANPDGPASFRQSPIGLIDEVRISKVARYKEDFTPAERFEPDDDTLALYHFDEGAGTIARDSSGNQLDAEIFGAKWTQWPQDKAKTVDTENDQSANHALEFEGEYAGVSLPVPYDGSHPLTIECRVRLEKSAYDQTQILNTNQFRGPFSLSLNSGRQMRLEFHWNTGGFQDPIVQSKEPFPFGETVHIAAVYSGKEIRLFVNGKLQESQPLPANYRFSRSTASIQSITIGSLPSGEPPIEFGKSILGLIDEVRISKVARYDENFTPAEQFEPDEDTLALYHFDEDSSRTVRDSSGNKRDGKNFGAKWVPWPKQLSRVENSSVTTANSTGKDTILIDSRVLLEEFRRFYTEQSPQERSEIEKKSDLFVVAMGLTTMRIHSPGFLRVTRRQDEAFARGEFDDAAARKRIESVLPKLKELKVELPVMTRRIVTQYEAQPISGARLELAAHLIEAAYDRVRPQAESSKASPLGFQWSLIPAGEFQMGTAEEDMNALPPDENWFFADFVPDRRRAETPQHRVTISKPFEISKHEVTVAQFRQFVKATGYQTTAEREGYGYGWNLGEWQEGAEFDWQNPGYEINDDHPVINVSWEDAVAFCRWMSSEDNHTYRLPTEAEWEYACRAGTTTLFSTGDDPDSLRGFANLADAGLRKQYDHVTWSVNWDDGFALTAPVGSFKPNAFGLYDMHGNAWEWCQDEYDTEWYETSPEKDPIRKGSEDIHVFRGGGFDNWPGFLRSADRYSSHSPTLRSQWAGFRIVREIDEDISETP